MLVFAKKVFLVTICCCLVACSTVTTTRVGVNYTPGAAAGEPTRGPATAFLKSGETLDFQIYTVSPTALHGMALSTRELRTIPWDQIDKIEKSDPDGAKTALLAVGILAVVLLVANSAVKSVASQLTPGP